MGEDAAPGHTIQVGRLAIPYINARDQVVQIRFRCIEDHDHRANFHGKYNTIAGDPGRVYNVRSIAVPGNQIHVAEGEFDAMILEKVGLNAVAIPGAKMWKSHHRELLLGFQNVYLWADPDDAGAEMVQVITKALPRTTPIRLTDGDVTDTYLRHGPDGLLALFRKYKKENHV